MNGSHVLTAVARDAGRKLHNLGSENGEGQQRGARSRAEVDAAGESNERARRARCRSRSCASDPDGNPLTFSATGCPPACRSTPRAGSFPARRPRRAPARSRSRRRSRTERCHIAARSRGPSRTSNRAPVLRSPRTRSSAANTSVSLQLTATDPDGTALTYQATGLPRRTHDQRVDRVDQRNLGAASAGVHSVTATASDGALTSTRTFAWSVDSSDTPVTGTSMAMAVPIPATYRGATGEWRVWPSSTNYGAADSDRLGYQHRRAGAADYDGDRRTDIAVYRPSTGTWHVLLSSTNMQSGLEIQWGNATDTSAGARPRS